MRWVLAIFALPALAQVPVISDVSVDSISHTAARVQWRTDISVGPHTIRLTAPAVVQYPTHTAVSTIHGIVIGGLAPATTYTYQACSAVNTANEACSTPDTFTTAAEPADRFRDPTLPTGAAISTPPSITGTTFTVAADCSDLQSNIDAAAAMADSLNHQILLPAGVACVGQFNLPARTGTGFIVVRSSAPDSALPPAGVRLTSDWPDSVLGIIASTAINNVVAAGINSVVATDHWYFLGVKFTAAYRPQDYLSVSAATNAVPIQVTTTTPHGYATNDVIQLGGVIGNTGANRFNWKITVLDPTHFTLNGSIGSGSYVSGGWVTKDPPVNSKLVNFNIYPMVGTSNNLVFDRCRFQGRDYPSRSMYGVDFSYCNNCGAINSEFRDLGAWLAVDPDDTTPAFTLIASSFGTLTSIAIDITGCHQCSVENNLVATSGISVFAQGSGVTDASHAVDITVRRNTFRWDTKYKLVTPSTGVYWESRQPLEFKRGERLLITGNEFDSTWTNGVTGNVPGQIVLTPRNTDGTPVLNGTNRIGDMTMTCNWMHGVVGGITASGGETFDHAVDVAGILNRMLIRNNLFSIDGANYSQGRVIAGSIFAGMPFYFPNGSEDYRIEHNTLYWQIGTQPDLFALDTTWGAGYRFTNNLMLTANVGGNIQPFGGLLFTGGSPPWTTTNGLTRRNSQLTATPGTPDPRTLIAHNVLVPTVTNARDIANYGNTTYSYSRANCVTYWTGLTGMTCLGMDTTTANAKIATVGWMNSVADWTLVPSSPAISAARADSDGLDAGADWGAVQAAMGFVRNARVVSAGTITAVIGYTAPADAACTVEYGTSAAFGTGARVSDASGGGSNTAYTPRAVTLSGLSPATSYYARILCPVQQPVVTFTTF